MTESEEPPQESQDPPPEPPPAFDPGPGSRFEPPDSRVRQAGATQAFGMACHLATLVTYCFRLAWFNVPGLLAPLLLWQLLETRYRGAVHHAKEAFHFQLNVLAWLLVAWGLSGLCCVGQWLYWAVNVANVVLTLAAAVRSAEGERYRYPGIVRILDQGS